MGLLLFPMGLFQKKNEKNEKNIVQQGRLPLEFSISVGKK